MAIDRDQLETFNEAMYVAAVPTEHSELKIGQLLDTGYHWWHTEDGEEVPEALVEDVDKFAHIAMQQPDTGFADHVEGPAHLAITAALAAVTVLDHRRYEDTDRDKIQPYHDMRRLYFRTFMQILEEDDGGEYSQRIAEVLYRKQSQGERISTRETCSGIVRRPELASPANLFVKIPLVSAEQECMMTREEWEEATWQSDRLQLVELGEEYDPSVDVDRDIVSVVEDNHVFVPIQDMELRFREYLVDWDRPFNALVDKRLETLQENERQWLQNNISAVDRKIRIFEAQERHDKLFRYLEPGESLVELVTDALSEVDGFRVGEWYTAEKIYDALELYNPDDERGEKVKDDIASAKSLGKKLSQYRENKRIDVEEQEVKNRYSVGYQGRSGSDIDVDDPADLFQLPCMANMEERLHEKKPDREDLFNLVRMIFWLPEFQDGDYDEVVEATHELFSRWDWYDYETTEYQTYNELTNEPDGENDEWLPRNCGHDSLEKYCIGQDLCPYSIYGSVPFRQEMYDEMDDGGNDSRFSH